MTTAPRVGIIDSGVYAKHPHVGGVLGGIRVESDGYSDNFLDCLGHGTAIAALIHFLEPAAGIVAVRVFDRTLATSMDRVIRAIDWCLEQNNQIINLSLGTENERHRARFAAAVERVRAGGSVLVSAYERSGHRILPGSLPGVIAVTADSACRREEYRVIERSGKSVFVAPPYPREIPGVPRERNLNGVSFAVAHMSAHLARQWREYGPQGDWEHSLIECLPVKLR